MELEVKTLETKQQEQNMKIVQQYADAFNKGDLDALVALFASDAEIQGVLGKANMERATEVWRQLITGLGIQLTIEGMIAEGDDVAVRYTERGIFKGSFMGHEPTGKSFEVAAMEWFIIRDGKIQQRWGTRDSASLARQIGLPLN
ncbi:ester cyclase [Pontibacter cellulosilyticus]|uniref:Ester cyclase n=1 Tax=Pontibacter cellulosilyticus TaxID=1720253 RepID=A0A923N4U1_9BACT|nr:ester cyclase [Pontibacter cellulosilyticus]MBC5991874.1 ester cyclase [Pontibacter cellulosilyticus]